MLLTNRNDTMLRFIKCLVSEVFMSECPSCEKRPTLPAPLSNSSLRLELKEAMFLGVGTYKLLLLQHLH